MGPGRKRGPTKAPPAAGQQPPSSDAPRDGAHAHPSKGGAQQMGSAVGGRQPMKRPRPADLSDNLTDYERERARTMMMNNRVFRSLGIAEVVSILNNSSNAKSKGAAREDSDPLYDPAGDENDIEHGVVDKVSETSVRSAGGTRGSKRVLAGPPQQDLGERVMTRKRARDQSSSEGGTNGSNEEDDAAALAPAAPAQVVEDEEMDIHEGGPNAMINQRSRGRSMGKDLDRMCRGLNSKLSVVIVEGKRRPEAPIQAAKLASESGIVLRQHMPIHTHWKEYKKDDSILKDFMGKVSAKFSMDTNDMAVQSACSDLLKGGQRQMRHKLKKKYFNDVPANEVITTAPLKGMTDDQWKELVEMWSTPEHTLKCLKATFSRDNVKYPHKTGSRCYIAQTYVVTKDKYKDAPPTAIDLFSDLHCSSRTGLSEPVKEAIERMKAIVAEPTEEGEDPKTAVDAVAEVLPSSKFLQNVGLKTSAPKKSATSAVCARVQELEVDVQAERQESAALRSQIEYQYNQLESLTAKIEEIETAKQKQQQEIDTLKKQGEETNSLLRRLLRLNQD